MADILNPDIHMAALEADIARLTVYNHLEVLECPVQMIDLPANSPYHLHRNQKAQPHHWRYCVVSYEGRKSLYLVDVHSAKIDLLEAQVRMLQPSTQEIQQRLAA